MRGNRYRAVDGQGWIGSIPAHAGEPRSPTSRSAWNGVYPRACGGTAQRPTPGAEDAGLSPRMRGNPNSTSKSTPVMGSIPAHAGEPRGFERLCGHARVYPRACGGTGDRPRAVVVFWGLSPRMRGNRLRGGGEIDVVGSIPAHAGEPCLNASSWSRRGVYPRACGGTVPAPPAGRRHPGLSPRMRGNPLRVEVGLAPIGSIPAHAGEPIPPLTSNSLSRVYPRACGGTPVAYTLTSQASGLSPRMRGNRVPD